MPVHCTTLIRGLDAAAYDQIALQLGPLLRAAPGFISHVAYPAQPGWTISEIWNSELQFRTFFDATVAPNLPPGTEADVVDLHNVVVAQRA